MLSNENDTLDNLLQIIIASLEDIKATDILVMDTSQRTPLFDRIVIASAGSTRQVKALAQNVATNVKQAEFDLIGIEGLDSGEWALVDIGSVMVHVMLPSTRKYYNLETLWQSTTK